MKLATFNINNVNKRLPNLLAWLKSAKPDVVCLQELKAKQDAFPLAAIEQAGYYAAWVGQKSWNRRGRAWLAQCRERRRRVLTQSGPRVDRVLASPAYAPDPLDRQFAPVLASTLWEA